MGDTNNVGSMILWRWRSLGSTATPVELAESLTVEGLRDDDTPERFKKAVTSYRHLRHDARVATIRRALAAAGAEAM